MDYDPMSSMDALQMLTPEQLRRALTPFQQQDALLQQQLAQAQALRKGSGVQHSTGLGAALGGLGDALNSGIGAYKTHQLQGQQQQLLGDMQSEGTDRLSAILAALRNKAPPAPAAAPAAVAPAMAGGFIPFHF